MSLYDTLLDDLVSKSNGKLHRKQIDETITLASVAENLPKWRVLIAFAQVLPAYEDFEASMRALESAAPLSESEFSQVSEGILRMAEEQ